MLNVIFHADLWWDHSTEYHGAGRADGAGAAIKLLYIIWSLWTKTSGDGPTFVRACNSGEIRKLCKRTCFRSIVLNFCKVNYGAKVFEAVLGPPDSTTKNKNVIGALHTAGSIATSWMHDGVLTRMPGVVRVRQFSGEGEWTFVDVTHSAHNGRGMMCPRCTRKNAHPMHHGAGPCPLEAGLPTDIEVPSIPQPAESRFDGCGEQQSKHPVVARSRGVLKNVESKLTVPMLKEFLGKHGKSTAGLRDELLARAKGCEGWGQKDADAESSVREGQRDAEGVESGEDGEDGESDGDGDTAWTAVQAVTKQKPGDPEPLYWFKWFNSSRGSWETASSWLDREGLDLEQGLSQADVDARIQELDAECPYFVEDVNGRRVVGGGRGGPQTQYRFKWLNETKVTWETALSWLGKYGTLTFKEGLSKETIIEKIEELEAAATAGAATKPAKRAKRR